MVGPFEVGGVQIPLSVRIAGLQEGIARAKKELEGLGIKTQEVAARTKVASTQLQKGVQDSGKALGSFANRVGNAGVRLIGLQLILQQFGSRAGTGRFGKQVRAASDSLTVFVTAVSIVPGPVGIAIGAIGALVTAVVSMSSETAESKAAIDAWRASLIQTTEVIQLLVDGVIRQRIGQEGLTTALAIARKELQANLTLIISREKREAELQKLLKAGTITQRDVTIQMISLGVSIAEARTKTAALTATFTRLFAEVEDQTAVNNANVAVDALGESLVLLGKSAEAGLISPMQKADAELKSVEDTLRSMFIALNDLSRKGLEEFGAGIERNIAQLKEQRAAIEGTITSLQATQALDEALAEGAEVEEIRDQRRKRDARLAAEATEEAFTASFSGPFTQTIGQSVFDGIVRGADAMEVVADVGRGLFENFLSQSIEGFQTGMISAFKSIAGAGGEALGGVLTGLVGLAGFFLSGKSKQGSEQSFEGVQSAIESSQAVRGIVAGPTNVAIAAVGDDLRRALAPSQALLEAQLRELIAIRTNTGGASGTSGTLPFAGSVATP